jgi:hypothetical protein
MCTIKGIKQTELAETDDKKIILKGNQTRAKTKEVVIAWKGERMGSSIASLLCQKKT